MLDTTSPVVAPYATVLHYLRASIQAEQQFCSIVSQMLFIPEFKNQASLQPIHRENYETSYHRNTAAGNLKRILEAHRIEEILVLMTIECMMEARKHDKAAEAGLAQLHATSPEGQTLLNQAYDWHTERKRQLKTAARTLYAVVGPTVWQKGSALAE